MSNKINHFFTCDLCGKTEDVGYRGEVPHSWTRVEVKTISGYGFFTSFDLCGACGWDGITRKGNTDLISKFLKMIGLPRAKKQ